jgi:predicted RNA-binding protein
LTVTSRLEYALKDIFGYTKEFLGKHFQTDIDLIVVVKAGDHVVMRDSFDGVEMPILLLEGVLDSLREKKGN